MDDNVQSQPAGAGTYNDAGLKSDGLDDMPSAMRGMGIARHTLGLLLLLIVVLLWTTSNFLGSVC